jgi:dihydroneopterin aldolase
MLSVQLLDLAFHAFHGVYEAEAKTGNNFQVDLVVKYDESHIKFDSINSVINYEDLYMIIKKRMAIPSPLLEEVAEAIIRKVMHQYSYVKEISVSIFKLQPPIENFKGKVGITLHKNFEK